MGLKKVRVSKSELRTLLGVPDDLELVDVVVKRDPTFLFVYVQSDKFPDVPEFAEVPIEDIEITVDTNGQVYTEWEI